jgi:hypothetical protein
MYKVTKKFLSGSLKGITLVESTTVRFFVGDVIKGIGGSTYEVIECVRV